MPDAPRPCDPLLDLVGFKISASAPDAEPQAPAQDHWALTQHWCLSDDTPLPEMDDGSKLHMSDWATDGVTKALDGAMAAAPPPMAEGPVFARGQIGKICRSFVSGKQKHGARLHVGQPMGRGALS